MILIALGEMRVIPTSQALAPLAAGAIMDRFDSRWVRYGCSLICAISLSGFYGLYPHARERLIEKQVTDVSERREGVKDAI